MTLRINLPLLAPLLIALATACAAPDATTSSGKKDDDNTAGAKKDKGDKGDESESKSEKSSEKPPTEPGDDIGMKDFLFPPVIFTGFTDGTQVFKVPVWTDIEGNVTWSAADPSIVDIVPVNPPADYDPELDKKEGLPPLQFAMITTKKAGKTTVSVSGNGKTATSEVLVRAFTSAEYTLGQTRYKTGGTGDRQPCAGCHEKADGWDHSPTWVSIVPDEEILGAIQTGEYRFEDEVWTLNKGNHKWNLTEEEKPGILAYLRSLPPAGF
jgi:hypothetical protein